MEFCCNSTITHPRHDCLPNSRILKVLSDPSNDIMQESFSSDEI